MCRTCPGVRVLQPAERGYCFASEPVHARIQAHSPSPSLPFIKHNDILRDVSNSNRWSFCCRGSTWQYGGVNVCSWHEADRRVVQSTRAAPERKHRMAKVNMSFLYVCSQVGLLTVLCGKVCRYAWHSRVIGSAVTYPRDVDAGGATRYDGVLIPVADPA